jgi:hypothetical protein
VAVLPEGWGEGQNRLFLSGAGLEEEFRSAIRQLWQEHKSPGFRKSKESREQFVQVAWNCFLVFLSACDHVYNLLVEDSRSYGALSCFCTISWSKVPGAVVAVQSREGSRGYGALVCKPGASAQSPG